jgi:hypothetical protein
MIWASILDNKTMKLKNNTSNDIALMLNRYLKFWWSTIFILNPINAHLNKDTWITSESSSNQEKYTWNRPKLTKSKNRKHPPMSKKSANS